jgi:hypothetical protein
MHYLDFAVEFAGCLFKGYPGVDLFLRNDFL